MAVVVSDRGLEVADAGSVFRDAYASLRPAARVSVVDWAESHVVLDSKHHAEPGPLRIRSRTPYLVEPMEAFADPGVRSIVLMTSTQVGKTTALLVMLGYAAVQDPGPALVVYPNQKSAQKISKERVQPLFADSPKLRHLIPEDDDRWTILRMEFDRMVLDLAWAGSAMSLAASAKRYVFKDEVYKYPSLPSEGDPGKLATERQRTFWNSKEVEASTPTTQNGRIHVAYEATDRRKYHVPCPECGTYQVLRFDQVMVPEDERDPERIRAERLAWYECAECGVAIPEGAKTEMLARGVWCPEDCTVDAEGRVQGDVPLGAKRGYWINALYSPWLTWSEVIAEFFESKDDVGLLQNFKNSWLGEVWYGETEQFEEEDVKALAAGTGYLLLEVPREGPVPEGVRVLTAGVDVQKRNLYYTIRGWGVGEESWLIDCGTVGDLGRLEEAVLDRSFAGSAGKAFQVRLVCIDARYQTYRIYQFARKHAARVKAIQGSPLRMASPYAMHKVDKHPDTGVALKQSFRYWRLDTHYYKDKIVGLAGEDGAGWHLPEDVPKDYTTQFVSEHKIRERDKYGRNKEVWAPRSAGRANHLWDCEVYATAAADILYVWRLRADPPSPRPKRARRAGPSAGGRDWFKRS